MKVNTITWIILILLSVTSFSIAGSPVAGLVLAAAAAKAALVGWQFMELRYAHPIWMSALLAFLVAVLGLIYVQSRFG